jgi:hypothetical protein
MNPRHNYRHYLLCPGAAIMIIGLLGHRVAFERKIVAAEAGRGAAFVDELPALSLICVSSSSLLTSHPLPVCTLVTLIFVSPPKNAFKHAPPRSAAPRVSSEACNAFYQMLGARTAVFLLRCRARRITPHTEKLHSFMHGRRCAVCGKITW